MPNGGALPYPHLEFSGQATAAPYTHPQAGGRSDFPKPPRSRRDHAEYLLAQIAGAKQEFTDIARRQQIEQELREYGLILNLESEPSFPLKFESLDRARPPYGRETIVLLNVRVRYDEQHRKITCASIFVPFGKLHELESWVVGYRDRLSRWGRPSNEDLIANIRHIGLAAIEELWTDSAQIPSPGVNAWWEVWIRRGGFDWETQFLGEVERLGLTMPERRIVLPEHIVRLVYATREQLESSLRLLNTLAEIRRPRPCSSPVLEMSREEQSELVNDAKSRLTPPGESAPSVCILDRGVNRGHPLLEDLLASNHMFTIDPASGTADHSVLPHGTQMAGIAGYGDLLELLSSTTEWRQSHRLESVKLLKSGDEHEPDLYGAVTRQAVTFPETESQRLRSFCLAITAPPQEANGRPSSWSAAIDELVVGFGEADDSVRAPKRLVFVAAGNCRDFVNGYEYPRSLGEASVEDPGQCWNGITVGAMTEIGLPEEGPDETGRNEAVALPGGLGPTSRTSLPWVPDGQDWPYKPDIVLEGGNYARRDDGEIWPARSLRLVTTAPDFRTRPLIDFGDTSAATAAAARLGALLEVSYPHLWPESIRGLVVHSARWTPVMLDGLDPHKSGVSGQVKRLLRGVGWGVPDFQRALRSAESQATLICENQLQPYRMDGSKVKTNEWHTHALPWPSEILQDAGQAEVTLRVTLSYFVEPSPGSRVQPTRSRFRYPGCALRFEVKNPTETEFGFHRRLNAEIATDEEDLEDGESGSDNRWVLGTKGRRIGGALHQDIWRGSGADLAGMDEIAVIPIKGWWATRKFPEGHECHNCHDRRIRYSLIVSIETEAPLPIYTTIRNLIELPIQVST